MYVSPRWKKVFRELVKNKARNLLVVLSIAVGVFAIGFILNAQYILIQDMNTSYQAVQPASAVLFTTEPFDEELVFTVRKLPEIADADARRRVFLRFQVGPDQWENIEVYALADYEDSRINIVSSVTGAWPPPDRQILIERASLNYVGKELGDSIRVKTPLGLERELPIAGTAYDINQVSADIRGRAYGYVTFETLEWLGYSHLYEQMHIVAAGDASDLSTIETAVDAASDKIEKIGFDVNEVFISPNPGQHPEISLIQAIVLVLGVLGGLSLFASGFLLTNTITAVLIQQTREIGIMKSLGGSTRKLVHMYLSMIFVFGCGALLIGIMPAFFAARLAAQYVAELINFNIYTDTFSVQIILIQFAIGLGAPLFAGLYPILSGVRITIREAISSNALSASGELGNGFIDSVMARIYFLSRPLLLSLRNTFRRKGRLVLTLTTLTLSGALFISVFSVQASTLKTLTVANQYWNYDIEISLATSERLPEVEHVLADVPNITAYDGWAIERGRRLRLDGREGNDFLIVGLDPQTQMMHPTLVDGRWLQDDDMNAVVINSLLLRFEPDLAVGQMITIKMDGKETSWQIVGLLNGPLTAPALFMPYSQHAKITNNVDKVNSLQIQLNDSSPSFQNSTQSYLDEYLPTHNFAIAKSETISTRQNQLTNEFTPILVFLSIMSLLLATVGGFGLVGTMSINVLERTKEIAVLRSVGASNGVVRRLVMVEGVIIAVISWFFSILCAYPISYLMSEQVGLALLETPLEFQFSLLGIGVWLLSVVILAMIATLLPARRASRITIREALIHD